MDLQTASGSMVLYDGPLRVRILLEDPATGEALVEEEVRPVLEPGDHVTWTYPADGITVTVS